MPNNPQLKVDADGNVNGFPLLRQTTWTLPDNQILLALEVATTPQELEAMEGQTIQLFLKPIQAIELARMLTDAGELRR